MCLTDNLRQIRNVLLALFCQIARNSMLPSGPLMGEKRHIQHLKACRVRVFHIILQHLKVNLRLADNALFADLALSGLKLRLDQVGNMAVLGQQAETTGSTSLREINDTSMTQNDGVSSSISGVYIAVLVRSMHLTCGS